MQIYKREPAVTEELFEEEEEEEKEEELPGKGDKSCYFFNYEMECRIQRAR